MAVVATIDLLTIIGSLSLSNTNDLALPKIPSSLAVVLAIDAASPAATPSPITASASAAHLAPYPAILDVTPKAFNAPPQAKPAPIEPTVYPKFFTMLSKKKLPVNKLAGSHQLPFLSRSVL